MIWNTDHHQLVVGQQNGAELWFAGRIGYDSQIYGATHDVLVNFVCPVVFDLNIYFRIFFEKSFDEGVQLIQPNTVNRCYPDRASFCTPDIFDALTNRVGPGQLIDIRLKYREKGSNLVLRFVILTIKV